MPTRIHTHIHHLSPSRPAATSNLTHTRCLTLACTHTRSQKNTAVSSAHPAIAKPGPIPTVARTSVTPRLVHLHWADMRTGRIWLSAGGGPHMMILTPVPISNTASSTPPLQTTPTLVMMATRGPLVKHVLWLTRMGQSGEVTEHRSRSRQSPLFRQRPRPWRAGEKLLSSAMFQF